MSRRGAMQVAPPFSLSRKAARARPVEIGIGENENGVLAGKFHHGGRVAPASAERTSRPFSDEPVKTTLSTPSAMARARLQRSRAGW